MAINSLWPSKAFWVNIELGNGLLPVQRQAITWTNAGILSTGSRGITSVKMKFAVKCESKYNSFYSRNEFENGGCKMTDILFRPQCIKYLQLDSLEAHEHLPPKDILMVLCEYFGKILLEWGRILVCDRHMQCSFHNNFHGFPVCIVDLQINLVSQPPSNGLN